MLGSGLGRPKRVFWLGLRILCCKTTSTYFADKVDRPKSVKRITHYLQELYRYIVRLVIARPIKRVAVFFFPGREYFKVTGGDDGEKGQ